jgi:flagellin-like protein
MKNALYFSKIWLSTKLGRFIKDERGEVNIVATIILLGIAVLLAVAFRKQINNLVESVFDAIRGKEVDLTEDFK